MRMNSHGDAGVIREVLPEQEAPLGCAFMSQCVFSVDSVLHRRDRTGFNVSLFVLVSRVCRELRFRARPGTGTGR